MDFELEKHDEDWARGFRDACRVEAERPAAFWTAQRAGIRQRINTRTRRPIWLVTVAAALLFTFAAALLRSAPSRPLPDPNRVAAISDQQLLTDIDETLSNPTPEALAPVDLISQDMDRSFNARGKKETR